MVCVLWTFSTISGVSVGAWTRFAFVTLVFFSFSFYCFCSAVSAFVALEVKSVGKGSLKTIMTRVGYAEGK